MRLCDEYSLRKGLDPYEVRRVDKAFLLHGEGRRVLVIKWVHEGPHPGCYEFSECLLDSKPMVLSTEKVSWEEYEGRLLGWLEKHPDLISDKRRVFMLSWEFFLRKHDDFLAANFDPLEVAGTLEDVVSAVSFLDKIGAVNPSVCEYWWQKVCEISSKYAFWACDLAKRNRVH